MTIFFAFVACVGGILAIIGPEWFVGADYDRGTEFVVGMLFIAWSHLWLITHKLEKLERRR